MKEITIKLQLRDGEKQGALCWRVYVQHDGLEGLHQVLYTGDFSKDSVPWKTVVDALSKASCMIGENVKLQ